MASLRDGPRLRLNVCALWVVRSISIARLLPSLMSSLVEGQKSNANLAVAQLCVTGRLDEELPEGVVVGRPDLGAFLSKCARGETLVFVCGPEPLVKETRALAFNIGFTVYTEEFSF